MIYIWLRATLDWEDEQAFWAQVPARLRPRVELWNSTFNMPVHLHLAAPRELSWRAQSTSIAAKPYLAMMAELMDELEPR